MKLVYPCSTMNITQSYMGNFSHKANRMGSPSDYPIDEACDGPGRSWFFAPCDVRIVDLYGVSSPGTNAVWMESIGEVETPSGEMQISIMVIHPEDDDLRKLRIGQTFKQGEKMFREGRDGNATGNHFHMSVAAGRIKGPGWKKNSSGGWVIQASGRALKPEAAFFISHNTNIVSTGGLTFKTLSKEWKMGKVFADVPDDRWSAGYIEKAKELDLMNGDGSGLFHPSEPLTREGAAVLVVRLYEKLKREGGF